MIDALPRRAMPQRELPAAMIARCRYERDDASHSAIRQYARARLRHDADAADILPRDMMPDAATCQRADAARDALMP